MKLTRKNILITVAACAAAVRLIFALLFSNTAFADYHLVPGLDMQTLLRYSEWCGENSYAPFFTFHRLAIFLVWLLSGQIHQVWGVFVIQNIFGIAGTVCAADIVLKLTRSRKAALICGLAGTCYLPYLVYEYSILKETFAINLALFAFWSMLRALRRRFDLKSMLLFGFCCFAAVEGRIAMLPYLGSLGLYAAFKMWKRGKFKRVLASAVLPLILLTSASAFNALNWQFSPFFNVLSYNLQYNAVPAEVSAAQPFQPAATTADSKLKSVKNTVINAASRVPKLFKHGELPENQNIYFWCEKVPEFHLLLAPGLLIPLAAAGIMVILLSGKLNSRYGLLLLPLITLALPLCAREPIGRYRLMLIPYFFMISACAAVIFLKLKSPRRRGIVLLGAGAGAFFSIHNGDVPMRIRQSDYSAYAMALENTPGTAKEDIMAAYMDYWNSHNCSSEYAFRMIMDKALKYKDFETAYLAASQAAKNGINPDLICYFLAWSYALQENPEQVWQMLSYIKNPASLPPEYQAKAAMLQRDTARIMQMRQKMR